MVDSSFALVREGRGAGDPLGTIVGGGEKSVLKMYELHGDSTCFDTLKNSSDPSTMLHGQWRRLEFNKDYFNGTKIDFKIQPTQEDTGKMWLDEITNLGVTLKDTAFTLNPVKIVSIVYKEIYINGIAKLIPTGILKTSVLSRKIALKNAINGYEYQNDLDGCAYTWINLEELKNPSDIEKFLKKDLRENGMFRIGGTGRFKIHGNDNNLAAYSVIFESEKSNLNSPMDWNTFVTNVLNYKKLWVEFKYVPHQVINIDFTYKHNTKQLQKEERASLDVSRDYNLKFLNIYEKISSLCDCKTGSELNECLDEAYKLSEKYFEMWGMCANHDDSWGLRSFFNCQIKMTGDKDISSGWLCYQWAYFTQAALSSINLKYFTIQKSSIVDYTPDDPTTPENEEDITVKHNWVTIFTCNPSNEKSTENGIHLDPWVDVRIQAFSNNDYENRLKGLYPGRDGKRNFYSNTLYAKQVLRGWYLDFAEPEEINFDNAFGGANDW